MDTPESPETTVSAGFTVGRQQIDRTLVMYCPCLAGHSLYLLEMSPMSPILLDWPLGLILKRVHFVSLFYVLRVST